MQTTEPFVTQESDNPLAVRLFVAAERTARPYLGWGVLVTCMALSMVPAMALHENRWLALGPLQFGVDAAGPLAVATIWLLWGWRKPSAPRLHALYVTAALLVGVAVISQLLLGWLPTPIALWQAAFNRSWTSLGVSIVHEWVDVAARAMLWWQGVQMGGAAQDNLVFALIAAAILWCVGMTVAWAARRTRQGFAAGLPSLWLLGMVLIYSSGGRGLLIVALALTILLQMLLDHRVLQARWVGLNLDYSPGVLTDRVVAATAALALVLAVAALSPNLYIEPVVKRYYAWAAPLNQGTEAAFERLFPDLRGVSRWRGSSVGGLPNDFLLQGGPDLGSTPVFRVRTDESVAYDPYDFPYDEAVPPPGHTMRSGTFAEYDGRGWRNPRGLDHIPVHANEPWVDDVGWGRKRLVQSVLVDAASPVLYTAAEPMEVSVDASREVRDDNELVAIYGRERSYTVISAIPAVNEQMLRDLPDWNAADGAAADEFAPYLALPGTVTNRTRDLAARIMDGQPTAYDRAQAIETYLRQYEYDLDVPDLPAGVADVADYFLFDLQRGYCDYYATAFVVLGRLGGLPTRFATGFAVGNWNPAEAVWVVTESEAHSWPEVYFPEVGWIPFEPTAGRSPLVRIAAPEFSTSTGVAPAPVPMPVATTTESTTHWQMLFWLFPLALAGWGLVQAVAWWRRRREDPWQTLLAWGSRAGRPLGDGETVLEYGQGLAAFITTRQQRQADVKRVAAREVEAVSQAVSQLAYGPDDRRPAQRARLQAHWERLRGYLRLIKVR